MNRRDFLKKCILSGTALFASPFLIKNSLFAAKTGKLPVDLIAVKGGAPGKMFDIGINTLGGMKAFVKKGQTVLIKPNMSWASGPESGANTNPELIKKIVESCLSAGASKVYIIDHTLVRNSEKVSGVAEAAESAGGIVFNANSVSDYKNVKIPSAKILKTVQVHELLETANVFINVPVLKSHGGAKLTCAMKNLMGVVWDRQYWHRNGLDQCIADFPLYRKPDLNVVDAYYVMVNGGPRGNSASKVINPKMQFLSTDIVAVDAVSLAQARFWGIVKGNVPYIKMAYDNGLGKMDIKKMNIRKLSA